MDPEFGKGTIGKETQFILVKLIKLKRTQSVCTEKERKRKGKRGKTERK